MKTIIATIIAAVIAVVSGIGFVSESYFSNFSRTDMEADWTIEFVRHQVSAFNTEAVKFAVLTIIALVAAISFAAWHTHSKANAA